MMSRASGAAYPPGGLCPCGGSRGRLRAGARCGGGVWGGRRAHHRPLRHARLACDALVGWGHRCACVGRHSCATDDVAMGHTVTDLGGGGRGGHPIPAGADCRHHPTSPIQLRPTGGRPIVFLRYDDECAVRAALRIHPVDSAHAVEVEVGPGPAPVAAVGSGRW